MIVRFRDVEGIGFALEDGDVGVKIAKHPLTIFFYVCAAVVGAALSTLATVRLHEAGIIPHPRIWYFVPVAIAVWFLGIWYDERNTYLIVTRRRIYRRAMAFIADEPLDIFEYGTTLHIDAEWSWGILGWMLRMADVTFTASGRMTSVRFTKTRWGRRVETELSRITSDGA